MKRKLISQYITSSVLVMISMLLFALISCNNQDKDNIKSSSDIVRDDTPSIEQAYTIPHYLDILMEEKNPSSLESLEERLAGFYDNVDLDIEEEIKKYLQRKVEYDKSNIFNGVP